MRCERCGSEVLSYERELLLVATALRLEGEVLVLDTASLQVQGSRRDRYGIEFFATEAG